MLGGVNFLEKGSPSQALPRQLPQGGSQAVKFSAKVLGAKRNFPAVDLALPLGELAKPQALTERARHFPIILPFYTFSPRFSGKIMSELK